MWVIGALAGICTTLSNLPQVIKSWKTRKTKDISLLMYLILSTGLFLWAIYGFLIKDLPIMIANSIGFILVFSVLILKIRYK